MAIDICAEISSPGISPRISFSYDLNQPPDRIINPVQDRLDSNLIQPDPDFDFAISNFFVQELPSADELFSNGKILPIKIEKKIPSPRPSSITNQTHQHIIDNEPIDPCNAEKKSLKELLSQNLETDEDEDDYNDDHKPGSKSFWKFKRSSSLNCETSRRKSLIQSLQFLSRSNSTGSTPIPKTFQKEITTQKTSRLQKQASIPSRKSSSLWKSSSCSSTYYSYNCSSQKQPSLRKNFGSYNGNGVRISPVLNLTPPYISKATVSFFGFGSLFCNGKIKKKPK